MARAWAAIVTAAILWSTGCTSDSDVITLVPSPTEVGVDPADFLGDLRCSPNPGAMQSFVATLGAFEDEDDTTPFTLPSSQPTPCSRVAAFRDLVVVGQRYVATVDGYDRPADSLTPFGSASSGARQMRDVETGEVILPRWTTQCGTAAPSAVVAEPNRATFVTGCAPLADAAPSPTRVRLDPAGLLGADPCSTAPEVGVLDESGELAPVIALPCSSEPVDVAATPGRSYTLYATAQDAQATPLGAQCFATARAGETVTATCHPMTPDGAIRTELGEVLGVDDAPVCPEGAFYDAIGEQGLLNEVPLPCEATTLISPVEPGIHVFYVVVYDSEGTPLGDGAACAAEVEPGKTARAICK